MICNDLRRRTPSSCESRANANDYITNSFVYNAGPLSNFYQATNSGFIDHGDLSDSALAGFYHFCTTTGQVRELHGILDIGAHFLATTNGIALDTDQDGIGDLGEDVNGNSVVDSGETDWNNANDWGLRVFITRPRNGSIIP